MKIIGFIFWCSLLLPACRKNEVIQPGIPEGAFIRLYADVLILKDEATLSRADSLQLGRGLDSLYESHHTTRSQFDATLEYYKKDLSRWMKFYQAVISRLDSVQLEERLKGNK
jgi:uncharacterized protein DUF4296